MADGKRDETVPITEPQFQQAVASLKASIDRLDVEVQRVNTKLDNLPNLYMLRQEYDPRHHELVDDIKDHESQLRDVKTTQVAQKDWSAQEHARILETSIKRMEEMEQRLSERIDRSTDENRNSNLMKWGWAIAILASIISPIIMKLLSP